VVKHWIELAAMGVEIAAAGIIVFAAAEALLRSAPLSIRREMQHARTAVRLTLARWLALGLEFALAADILRTAIAPSWHDIGQLSAIAALRTLLNYFLAKEIAHEETAAVRERSPGVTSARSTSATLQA
jgi:uncharacterized membrane protein